MIKDSFFLHIKAREGVLQTDLRSKDTDIIHLGIPPSPAAPESPSGRWGRIKGRDGTWLFYHFSLEATHVSYAHIPVGEVVTRPHLRRVQIPGLGSPCQVTPALGRGGQPTLLPHTLILRKKHSRFFPYNFLEKAVAPHSSTLAWTIPWMEEPGRLWSMGSLRVGHEERLHFHFSLSCIGEGTGNPLQCSCLENPRDGGAWWAAVYGVAQSQTQLKWLSSSTAYNFHLSGFNLWRFNKTNESHLRWGY